MIRILILASIGAVISATPFFSDHPLGLESLFARKREAIGAIKEESTVCDSEECKLTAKIIKDGMDESVDPCEDFYEFTCGKWSQKNAAAENNTVWFVNMQVEKTVKKEVAALIRSPIEPDDLFAVKLAKKWFKSCMGGGAEESEGLGPIVATLWRHGGWPLIMEKGEWDDRIYNWQIVDDHFARLTGANTFFDVFSDQQSLDSASTLMLNTPHLPYGIHKFLSKPYHGSDTSDENNESGEGSQEFGSKEKIPVNGEDEEDNEEDEGIEEDNGPEDEEDEESQAERVSRRKSHKRLGHHKRSSSKHGVGRKHHETHLGRRPKRDIIEEIAFQKLRSLKKRAKHGVHQKSRKTGRKSSRHRHAVLGSQKKSSTGKNDLKRTGKAHNAKVKSANEKKDVVHKIKAKNDEENEEVKHSHHRVHHAAREMEDKEINEAADDNDNENEDNDSDNEVDTDGNDSNNEDDDNAGDEENDNEDEEGNDDGEDNEEKEDDEEKDEKTIEELTEMYRKYMISVAEALSKVRGVEISRDKLEKDVDDLIKFAIKVAQSTLADSELENTTLSEFQEWYDGLGSTTKTSKVNWQKKVLKLYTEAGLDYEGDIYVRITNSKYFEKIRAILDETPAEVVVNYIHWAFINQAALEASPEIKKLVQEWEPTRDQNKEETCIPPELSSAIEYQYVQKYVPPNVEKMVKDMIDDIQKEVEYLVKESTWMDDDTRHFTLDKLVYMGSQVGYPNWFQNSTLVQRYFQGLTIGTSHYENVMNFMRYQKWKRLRHTVISDDLPFMYMSMLEVNAFFHPIDNYVAITAADLQNPYFGLDRPWHVNFGILGATMGHEVNHGFDNERHVYDRKGKPMEWLSAMASAYHERADCFVRQYDNYDIIKGDEFRIKNYGNQTADENIADTMGLEVAYRAYLRRLREMKKSDPALPGLEKFNNNQTFFIAYGSSWCDGEDPNSLKDQFKSDVHSPSRLRVIGSVSNVDGFAESFNCPTGSPMNPENKCNIWT